MIPREAIIIVAIFAAFLILSLLTVNPKAKQKELPKYLSAFETDAYGASRFVDMAKSLGFQVELRTKDFIKGVPDDAGVIFILSPEESFLTTEMSQIHDWVKNGGTIIYGFKMRPFIDKLTMEDIFNEYMNYPLEEMSALSATEVEIKQDEKTSDFIPPSDKNITVKMTSATHEEPVAIFVNVDRIQNPLILSSKKLNRIILKLDTENPFPPPEAKKKPPPSSTDKKNTQKGNDKPADKSSEEWRILAREDEKPVIIAKKIGNGTAIAIANPLCLANGYIDAGDNAVFAANLLALTPKDKKCFFDEYRHGVNTSENIRIMNTGWGRTILAILVVGFLAICSRAIRFIPPRAFPVPERRSQIEYLRSMAQIMRKARASRTIARIFLRDFHERKTSDNLLIEKRNEIENQISSDKPSEIKILHAVRFLIEHESNKRDHYEVKK